MKIMRLFGGVVLALAFSLIFGCSGEPETTQIQVVYQTEMDTSEATELLNQLFDVQARQLGLPATSYSRRAYIAPTRGGDVTMLFGERYSLQATAEFLTHGRVPAKDPLADQVAFQTLDELTADAAQTVSLSDSCVSIRLSLADPRNFRIWGCGWYIEVTSQIIPHESFGYCLKVVAVNQASLKQAQAIKNFLVRTKREQGDSGVAWVAC
ncbi:MAG: hypothetical protein PHH01_00280 [Patescibacteria group bacterium]|nr:hypothetical protein [Patescibacteria group bacterium]